MGLALETARIKCKAYDIVCRKTRDCAGGIDALEEYPHEKETAQASGQDAEELLELVENGFDLHVGEHERESAADYAHHPRADLSAFPDGGKVSSWAMDATQWAVAEGLISGKGIDGTAYLQPQGNAIRAQIAQIFYNFLSK